MVRDIPIWQEYQNQNAITNLLSLENDNQQLPLGLLQSL
jgi:hypothetical protein